MYFVTLCCGILTLKTSDSFFRSFRFLRQNGAFSATEQNQIYKNSLFLEGEIQFGKKFFPFGDSYSNENYRLLGNPLVFLLICGMRLDSRYNRTSGRIVRKLG